MNVPRRILYSTLIAIIATVLAIQIFPEVEFVSYMGEVLLSGTLAIIALTTISFYQEDNLTMHDKNLLLNGFLIAVLVPTFYTAGAFMHQSQTSWSGGEIHWHADYEVLVEKNGELERLDLVDPSNFCERSKESGGYMCTLNDRTGVKEYHEHNDNRIHLEGVFKKREDATLSAFFKTFKGRLTGQELAYPTNDGEVRVEEDGNKTLKIIVKRGAGATRGWEIINNPEDYVISPYKRGPNLDDIFIIYDSTPPEEALQDLKGDDNYKGFELQKGGEGYGG